MNIFGLLLSLVLWLSVESASLNKILKTSNPDRRVRIRRSIPSHLFDNYRTYILTQGLLQTLQEDREQNSAIRYGTERSAVISSIPNTHSLDLFPPNVHVTVQGKNSTESIAVALAPQMSTYGAVQAAKNQYAYRNDGFLINPYRITGRAQGSGSSRCIVLDSVGGEQGVWNIQVKDESKQIIHNDKCIPPRRSLILRPGYSILISIESLTGS